MLHRGNSKSSSRLNRQKSTTSISSKQRRDHIDSEMARQQAHAAARSAFLRAHHERYSADGCGSHTMWRRKDGSGSDEQSNLSENRGSNDGEADPLRRQQSVRFVGPLAVQTRRSIGARASRDPLDSRTSTSTIPSQRSLDETAAHDGTMQRKDSRVETIVQAVAASDEYYTNEDDVASAPSSYRHVRKSKSIGSEIARPTITFHDATPERRPPGPARQTGSFHGLRAPKSMSFLRGSRTRATSAPRQNYDEAVQIARDNFLHSVEQQRLREQPSFIFRSRTRREEKPFRKSVRSDLQEKSDDTTLMPQLHGKNGSFINKARKTSQTIKNRIKGLFRRADDEDDKSPLPPQQIQAQHSYAIQNISVGEDTEKPGANAQTISSAVVSNVLSRVPSLHAVPSRDRLRSRTGSLSSLRSNASEKSRVTSWTSTKDETTTSRHTFAERERQRLSVIQENGAHVPSASFGRSSLAMRFPGYQVGQDPSEVAGLDEHQTCMSAPVDSARVYSALMKRLEESSPEAKLAKRVASSESQVMVHKVPVRKSSINSLSEISMNVTPLTIRHIIKEAESPIMTIAQARVLSSKIVVREVDDVFSPEDAPEQEHVAQNKGSIDGLPQRRMSWLRRAAKRPQPVLAKPDSASHVSENQQSQDLTKNESPVKPKSIGRREVGSGFFASSTQTIHRTPSPYRQAMALFGAEDDMKDVKHNKSPEAEIDVHKHVASALENNASTNSLTVPRVAYSASIYSCTTSGHDPMALRSTTSLNFSDDNGLSSARHLSVPGDATVYERAIHPVRTSVDASRIHSDSMDWTSWMARQVTAFERERTASHSRPRVVSASIDARVSQLADQQRGDTAGYRSFALCPQPGRHVREEAEILEDAESDSGDRVDEEQESVTEDAQTGQRKSEDSFRVTKAMLRHKASSTSIASTVFYNARSIEDDSSERSNLIVAAPTAPPPPPPAMPERTPLRQRRSYGLVQRSKSPRAIRDFETPRKSGSSTTSTPTGVLQAVDRQVGSVSPRRARTPTQLSLSENARKFDKLVGRKRTAGQENRAPYEMDELAYDHGRDREDDARKNSHDGRQLDRMGPLMGTAATMREAALQGTGSRKMVEGFLNSRRRKLAGTGSEEEGAFL